MAKQKISRNGGRRGLPRATPRSRSQQRPDASSTTVGAIVILLLYQGYTLSIVGIASPWIAKSFALDESKLARLFAWMAISAFGSLLLARLADRVGRRLVILGALILAPLFSAGAALAPTANDIRCVRDTGFRTARRISFIGDRVCSPRNFRSSSALAGRRPRRWRAQSAACSAI